MVMGYYVCIFVTVSQGGTMSDYRILVMTSDKYIHAVQVFSHLVNKYWHPNPSVVVSGFSPPDFSLPENFTFFSAGSQADFPFNRWSDALYVTLEYFKDDVFVLMLEDYWLTRPVNTEAVAYLADYMRRNKDVLKADLSTDRLYAGGTNMHYDTHQYLDIIKSDPNSAYHMSLWPGLWSNENLLRVMVPGESPHDMEITGSTRLGRNFPDLSVVGTRQNPLSITLGLRARDHSTVLTDGLKEEDLNDIKRLGYLSHWGIQ
jgi:hypothetical protein